MIFLLYPYIWHIFSYQQTLKVYLFRYKRINNNFGRVGGIWNGHVFLYSEWKWHEIIKILKLGILYGAKHSYTGLYFSEGLFSFNHLSIKISLVSEALYYIFPHCSVMAKLSDITIKPTICFYELITGKKNFSTVKSPSFQHVSFIFHQTILIKNGPNAWFRIFPNSAKVP